MDSKSAAVVGFIANLSPMYVGTRIEDLWCARSLVDGTLILPVEEDDSEQQEGFVKVQWQGDSTRETEALGADIATVAVVRYVEFHNVGQAEKRKAAELKGLAEHFEFKTGCSLYLPHASESSSELVATVRRAVGRMGEKAFIDLIMKAIGA
ncbi:hypothetical protein [Lysobacter silvisoli]|uniref:Uncharacterized protein n=1 Tax=Lysobacter silvisoli TaxID=2293254 RepID=A0A371JWC4_9GAMM|nr:hypothetical protein [Lysobacter silvisoli]RDZ25983.1 hypothetical protein DX914_19155 [Lysobacter silvisoli]